MAIDIDAPCGGDCDDVRNECLLSDHGDKAQEICERDQMLIRAIVVLVIVMNVPYGRFILYPFMLFSTWVHEMCHGIAAILMGGKIASLKIFSDGSGVAYTSLPGGDFYSVRRVFVASAGYTGTALTGGILLLFRRTNRGPRIGTIGIGALILFSCVFLVRNGFGLFILLPMSLGIAICGWAMNDDFVRILYSFLAITCCLNAVTSISYLFNESGDFTVRGEAQATDAHTVEKYFLLPYWFWACLWLIFAIVMCVIGFVFVID